MLSRRNPARLVLLRSLLIAAAILATIGPARWPHAIAAPTIASAIIVPSSTSAPADGVTAITLVASVHDVGGAAIQGIALRFDSDHPATVLTQPLTTTDVLGRVTGSIISRAQGPATIALVDTSTGSPLAYTQVTFLPAPDRAASTVQAGAVLAEAGSVGSTVPITVTVFDYQRLPLPLRTIRLTTANPGDTIVQPPLTNSLGQTVGTVSFTSTTEVISAIDVSSGVALGSVSVPGIAGQAPAAVSGIHALLQPSATRMGNGTTRTKDEDSDAISVRLTLLDGQNRPLAGKRVALQASAAFIDPGTPASTNDAGSATFRVRVRRLERHYGAASGPVALGAVDLTDRQPLTAAAQITVYNRVAVLLQGLGSDLACTPQKCIDPLFSQISSDALAPIGYNLDGDGTHRTEIEYSFRGGTMVRLPNGTWQWLIASYRPCDTVQPLERSALALRDELQSYRARYPYTTFEIIAHSLGGLVALYALAGDGGAFLHRLGPAAVDKIVTVDSPVNGVNDPRRLLLLADLLGGAAMLHGCRGQLFGASLLSRMLAIGRQTPGVQERWVAALHGEGVEVLTITNRDDLMVPEPLAIVDDGRATHASDRIRYALGSSDYLNGHGAVLIRHRADGTPNPFWSPFVGTLQAYLTDTCATFAPAGAACPYPRINQGF